MQDAPFVLTARYVVTMDDALRVYSPGYVALRQDTIASVGGLEDAPESAGRIDYGDAAIIPGLINSHSHVAMSLMRGVADDLEVDEWLKNHIWPLEARFVSADYVHTGTLLSAVEMLKSGTTCFADMYFFEDAVAQACLEAGIRVLIGEGVIAFPTPSVKEPGAVFEVIRRQAERYQDSELVKVHVAAHSTYATSEEQLRRCAGLAAELNLPIQIHCAESKREAVECLEKHGKSQLTYLNDLGLLDASVPVCLVHMVWPQEEDWDLLGRGNVSVVSCPQSNLKLGSGIPPIARYALQGVRVVLGTDGAASNNNLDVWEEMRLAAFLAKGLSLDPTSVPARRALAMLTADAARAWGLWERLGSLETGKKADLVVVDLARPNTTPAYDVYSTLVYAASAANVRDVFIAGRQVVRDGSVVTVDEDEVLARARELALQIKEASDA